MQAAGVVVVLMVKLAAGVQFGKNDLKPRDVELWVRVSRHAPAIVPNAGRAILMQGYLHLISKIIGRLINGVVNDFPQQMMQAAGPGGTNVHARTVPDRVQFLEHLNIFRCILLRHVHSLRDCSRRNRPAAGICSKYSIARLDGTRKAAFVLVISK